MRKFEKELIAKIQISNLVSDDPYTTDFYYQIFSLRHDGPDADPASSVSAIPGLKNVATNQILTGKGNSTTVSNQMQAQMKKLIEKRKQRPPREAPSLEGVLGKISGNSVHKSRRTIPMNSSTLSKTNFNVSLSQGLVLKSIEHVYDLVLELEKLKRQMPDDDEEVLEWLMCFTQGNQVGYYKAGIMGCVISFGEYPDRRSSSICVHAQL